MSYPSPNAPNAEEIRAAIQQAGMTHQEAADAMGIRYDTLRKWLAKTSKVSDLYISQVLAFIAKHSDRATAVSPPPSVVKEPDPSPYAAEPRTTRDKEVAMNARFSEILLLQRYTTERLVSIIEASSAHGIRLPEDKIALEAHRHAGKATGR